MIYFAKKDILKLVNKYFKDSPNIAEFEGELNKVLSNYEDDGK